MTRLPSKYPLNMIQVWLVVAALAVGVGGEGLRVGTWDAPVRVYSSRYLAPQETTGFDEPSSGDPADIPEPYFDEPPTDQDTYRYKPEFFSAPVRSAVAEPTSTETGQIPMSERFVTQKRYDVDEEYNKTLANRPKEANITENAVESQNGTSNDTILQGKRCGGESCSGCSICGKRQSCDCVPIHPKMKDFKWSMNKHCMNLEANINLFFKEEKFWCRIKTIIMNAVEEALSNRCTLCSDAGFGSHQ